MNEQTSHTPPGTEQWTAFQKIWTETFNKMFQIGGTFSPESAPPEFARQMRSSIFQAMAQSWDEFLRSPQFLDGMKQWMESAIAFRQMTNDTLSRAHDAMQSPSRTDMDALLQAIRHVEQRLSDRIEELESKMSEAAPRRAGKATERRQPISRKKKTGKGRTRKGAP